MTAKTVTLPIVIALDAAWSAIRKAHPDVPACAITLGSGTETAATKHGHWSSSRWSTHDGHLSELFVAGEGLKRGGRSTMGTLLHEAGHSLAEVREIKDTSRNGRYHNARFRKLATELGIDVAQDPTIGWSVTTVPDATAKKYARQIAALDAAITATRKPNAHLSAASRTSNNNGQSVSCECPRKIRVSDSVLDEGPITCGNCGSDFEMRG